MITIISSAKTLNFDPISQIFNSTTPIFPAITNQLLEILKTYSQEQLAKIMNISEKLAAANWQRFQNFDKQHNKAAIFAYAGDVFNNIKASELDHQAMDFLQSHLLIISGLYGALRPLDTIQPYRLEMASTLPEIKNLNKFWQGEITNHITQILDNHKSKYLLNLASQEYSAVIAMNQLKYPMINIYFKENKKGKLQTIGTNAKKARGNMVNFIAINSIDEPMQLKNFSYSGYQFSTCDSSGSDLIFVKN